MCYHGFLFKATEEKGFALKTTRIEGRTETPEDILLGCCAVTLESYPRPPKRIFFFSNCCLDQLRKLPGFEQPIWPSRFDFFQGPMPEPFSTDLTAHRI